MKKSNEALKKEVVLIKRLLSHQLSLSEASRFQNEDAISRQISAAVVIIVGRRDVPLNDLSDLCVGPFVHLFDLLLSITRSIVSGFYNIREDDNVVFGC